MSPFIYIHQAFQNLLSIAHDSPLPKLVRSLTYDIGIVPEFKNEKSW